MTKPVQIQPVAWIKQGRIPDMTTDPLMKMAWECDGAIVIPLIPEATLLQVRETLEAKAKEWLEFKRDRHITGSAGATITNFSNELFSLAATLGNQGPALTNDAGEGA